MKLSELCDVQTGIIKGRLKDKASSEPIGRMRVLTPKAIVNGYIDDAALEMEEYSKEPLPSFIAKEGDVVMKLSKPYDFCYIDKEHEGLLVSSFCCIITPKNSEMAWYIMSFLASNNCNKQISINCAGALTAIVRVTSIRDLELPKFSTEQALEIGKNYKKVCELKKTIDEIYKWELINNSLNFDKENN